MCVEETELSTCVIRSNRKLTHDELKTMAERRRVNGKVRFRETRDVDIWCGEARVAGRRWLGYDSGKECPFAV